MMLEVVAFYNCGHRPKVICKGQIDPKRIDAELSRLVRGVVGEDGKVRFSCHCGRGAARLIMKIDGEIIANDAAELFRGLPGVELTPAPAPDNN